MKRESCIPGWVQMVESEPDRKAIGEIYRAKAIVCMNERGDGVELEVPPVDMKFVNDIASSMGLVYEVPLDYHELLAMIRVYYSSDIEEYCVKSAEHSRNAGSKNDYGKDRWDLVPDLAMRQVVKCLTFGANEYGDTNWRAVKNAEGRYYAAAQRHQSGWRTGEQNDKDSGLHPLAHAITDLLFLLQRDLEAADEA